MYEFDENVILDFSHVRYIAQVHQILKKAFDFPEYYGENWSAFWDCMTDLIGTEPLYVEIRGLFNLKQRLPGVAEKLVELFQMWKGSYGGKYASYNRIFLVEDNHETELTAIVNGDA